MLNFDASTADRVANVLPESDVEEGRKIVSDRHCGVTLARRAEPNGFRVETLRDLTAPAPIAGSWPYAFPSRAHDFIPVPGDSGNSDETKGTGRLPR